MAEAEGVYLSIDWPQSYMETPCSYIYGRGE